MPCHVMSCCNFKTSWALTVKRGIELCPFSASLELLSNLLNCTSIKEDFCRSRRQQFNILRKKLIMRAEEKNPRWHRFSKIVVLFSRWRRHGQAPAFERLSGPFLGRRFFRRSSFSFSSPFFALIFMRPQCAV